MTVDARHRGRARRYFFATSADQLQVLTDSLHAFHQDMGMEIDAAKADVCYLVVFDQIADTYPYRWQFQNRYLGLILREHARLCHDSGHASQGTGCFSEKMHPSQVINVGYWPAQLDSSACSKAMHMWSPLVCMAVTSGAPGSE